MKKMNKFIVMGIVGVSSMYGVEAAGVAFYNSYQESIHTIKAAKIYNEVWSEISTRDVSEKIRIYRDLVSNAPDTYRAGIIPTKANKVELPSYLPGAEDIEQKAQDLSHRTTLKKIAYK